jgi:hypothetical protein
LKTAKQVGLTISPNVLASGSGDQVIEDNHAAMPGLN